MLSQKQVLYLACQANPHRVVIFLYCRFVQSREPEYFLLHTCKKPHQPLQASRYLRPLQDLQQERFTRSHFNSSRPKHAHQEQSLPCQHPQAAKASRHRPSSPQVQRHPKPRGQETAPRTVAAGPGTGGPRARGGGRERPGLRRCDERAETSRIGRMGGTVGAPAAPVRRRRQASPKQTGRGGRRAPWQSRAAGPRSPAGRGWEVLPAGGRKCRRCRGDGAWQPWRCRAGWSGLRLPARRRWCRTVTSAAGRAGLLLSPATCFRVTLQRAGGGRQRCRGRPGTRDRAAAEDTRPPAGDAAPDGGTGPYTQGSVYSC